MYEVQVTMFNKASPMVFFQKVPIDFFIIFFLSPFQIQRTLQWGALILESNAGLPHFSLALGWSAFGDHRQGFELKRIHGRRREFQQLLVIYYNSPKTWRISQHLLVEM